MTLAEAKVWIFFSFFFFIPCLVLWFISAGLHKWFFTSFSTPFTCPCSQADAIISRLKITGQLKEFTKEVLLITADTVCNFQHILFQQKNKIKTAKFLLVQLRSKSLRFLWNYRLANLTNSRLWIIFHKNVRFI